MPQYTYSGWDGNRQKNCKGKIEASSPDTATMALRSQNIVVTEIREVVKVQKTKAKAKSGGGLGNMTIGTPVIKRKELTVVTRQLAILLSAGLPLIRSLRTLEKQAKNPPTMIVLGKTADIVEGGATFAEALSQSPESFDKL